MNNQELTNGQINQPALQMSPFEAIRQIDENGKEFWPSRDLARLLGYLDYDNFKAVVEKAKINCSNTGQCTDDHFRDITESIKSGKNTVREFNSYRLTRYASYLVVMNADPSKPMVAAGKTYFAIQTRRQELADAQAAREIPYPESILFNGKSPSGRKQYMTRDARKHLTKKYFSFWEEINNESVKAEREQREILQAQNTKLLEEICALQKENIALLKQQLAQNDIKVDSRFDWKPVTGNDLQ